MTWLYIIIAGIFEIFWVVALKHTSETIRVLPMICTLIGMGGSTIFLGFALRDIPIGTAYGIWTGVGAIGTTIIGILYYDEPPDFWRLFFIGLVCIGLVGLKLNSMEN